MLFKESKIYSAQQLSVFGLQIQTQYYLPLFVCVCLFVVVLHILCTNYSSFLPFLLYLSLFAAAVTFVRTLGAWCVLSTASCLTHLGRKKSRLQWKLWVFHNESTVFCVQYVYPLAANWLIRLWMCIWLAVIRLSRGSRGLNSRWCWVFTHKPLCLESEDALGHVKCTIYVRLCAIKEQQKFLWCTWVCVYTLTKPIHYVPISFFPHVVLLSAQRRLESARANC